jgi:transcriptional regulator with XRE-family HTH domain
MRRQPIDPTAAAFGPCVHRHRRLRGLSLRQLADESGVSYSHISAVEHGAKDISLSHAIRIARALQVPLASLLGAGEAA